jgi:hypothetical protein
MATPTSLKGSFTCRKSATWDQRVYFPSEERRAEDFFALKNLTASARFEPANLGTEGRHATCRPPKPLLSVSPYTLRYRLKTQLRGMSEQFKYVSQKVCDIWNTHSNHYSKIKLLLSAVQITAYFPLYPKPAHHSVQASLHNPLPPFFNSNLILSPNTYSVFRKSQCTLATVCRFDCQYRSCRWSVLLFHCIQFLNSDRNAIPVKCVIV